MSNNRLNLQHIRATYLVARELPNPGAVQVRLDGVLLNRLVTTCSKFLEQICHPDDSSVWLIRRLELEIGLELGGVEDELIAGVWGRQLALSIARAIADGPDGNSVQWFPNRGAYLAQFSFDLAQDRAWGKWYYRAFEGLQNLSAGAAIRTVLLHEAKWIGPALGLLAEQERLETLLVALSEGEARQLFEAGFSAEADGEMTREVVEQLVSVWDAAGLRLASVAGLATWHNALRLYARVNPAKIGGLQATIPALLGFAEVLRRTSQPARLLGYLAQGEMRQVRELISETTASTGLAIWLELAAGDHAWLLKIARMVNSFNSPNAEAGIKSPTTMFETELGGIFLLLPSLLDLGIMNLVEQVPYPSPPDTELSAVLRYLLFLKYFGPLQLQRVGDPTLRLLMGDYEPPGPEILAYLNQTASLELNLLCQKALLQYLARQGRVAAQVVVAELLTVGEDATSILLLRDLTQDVWLYAVPVNPPLASSIEAALSQGLALVQAALERKVEKVLVGEPLDIYFKQFEAYQSQLNPASPELEFFSLTPSGVTNLGFDLTWSLVARAGLQTFTRRLYGFEGSSAGYVYRNFLAGTSSLQRQGDQLWVKLPPSPLQLVLRLAGMDGQTYALPWLNDLQVILNLPGQG